MSGIDRDMLQTFTEESFDRLECITEDLEQLSEEEDSEGELVNSLFRETHNLKGAANLVGVKFVEQMAHCLENILERIRNGEESPDEQLVGLLEAGYRRIAELLKSPHMLPLIDASREIAVIEGKLRERKT